MVLSWANLGRKCFLEPARFIIASVSQLLICATKRFKTLRWSPRALVLKCLENPKGASGWENWSLQVSESWNVKDLTNYWIQPFLLTYQCGECAVVYIPFKITICLSLNRRMSWSFVEVKNHENIHVVSSISFKCSFYCLTWYQRKPLRLSLRKGAIMAFHKYELEFWKYLYAFPFSTFWHLRETLPVDCPRWSDPQHRSFQALQASTMPPLCK